MNNDSPVIMAAVDLGSNSFHMLISRYEHGEFTVIDRHRETVRLASGLNQDGELTEIVAQRALDCLQKFGQLLRPLDKSNIRVVGTNALRRMRNKGKFIETAEAALGSNIEIIAGREEARLIYLGVSKWSEQGDESKLVIDIGGGSTEIIAGKGDLPVCRESLEVGCVVLSEQFFADGVLSKSKFEQAILAAELAIQPVVNRFRLQGWNSVIGCSGTIKAMQTMTSAMGWSKGELTRDAVQRLLDHAIEVGSVDKLDLPELTEDRRPVFAGGLVVLHALFELFEIRGMEVSEIALREGVLYDLAGRSHNKDTRDISVSAMLTRWAVDEDRGNAVKQSALKLYKQVSFDWDLQDKHNQLILGWAAQLHELGLLISHDGYHRHGAYVIGNADLAGFAKRDQLLLAALIAGHRRKFPLAEFENLPASLVTPAKRLAVILRLAVLLHRSNDSDVSKTYKVTVKGQQIKLSFDDGWFAEHPLTEADLAQEQQWLKIIGVKLKYS